MLIDDLENLGFTREEAKVYLAILGLGESGVSGIAKRAGVHRVSCYHTLDKLVERGIISSYVKNKVKFFSVKNPEIIVTQLEEKLNRARGLLPELMSVSDALGYKPRIQYYEGFEGMKNIFEATLGAGEGEEIVGYTNLEKLPKVIPADYIRDYAKRKIKKRISARMISPRTKAAKKYLDLYYPRELDPKLMDILFIDSRRYRFEYEINIFRDFVSILSMNPDELIGIIIESPLMAKTHRLAFDLAWEGAKKIAS